MRKYKTYLLCIFGDSVLFGRAFIYLRDRMVKFAAISRLVDRNQYFKISEGTPDFKDEIPALKAQVVNLKLRIGANWDELERYKSKIRNLEEHWRQLNDDLTNAEATHADAVIISRCAMRYVQTLNDNIQQAAKDYKELAKEHRRVLENNELLSSRIECLIKDNMELAREVEVARSVPQLIQPLEKEIYPSSSVANSNATTTGEPVQKNK